MSQLALALPVKAPPTAPRWVPDLRGLAWYRDASEGGRWASILVLRVEGRHVTGATNHGNRTFDLSELYERPPGLQGGRRG